MIKPGARTRAGTASLSGHLRGGGCVQPASSPALSRGEGRRGASQGGVEAILLRLLGVFLSDFHDITFYTYL